MMRITRRKFLTASTLAVPLAIPRPTAGSDEATQVSPQGYFTVAQRAGRWWFIDPSGQRFFSLAVNHIDPSTLRYIENVHIWRNDYGNSMQRWLQEAVAPDLRRLAHPDQPTTRRRVVVRRALARKIGQEC